MAMMERHSAARCDISRSRRVVYRRFSCLRILRYKQHSSPKPVLTSSAIAWRALSASGPVTSTKMLHPGEAANIMRSRIDVPSTDWSSRLTVILASKLSAHWTNLAEARAWRPRLLMMVRLCWRGSVAGASGEEGLATVQVERLVSFCIGPNITPLSGK